MLHNGRDRTFDYRLQVNEGAAYWFDQATRWQRVAGAALCSCAQLDQKVRKANRRFTICFSAAAVYLVLDIAKWGLGS